MSIINPSFFIRDINIPNAEVNPTKETVELYIEKYERQCLRYLLGDILYKAYLDNPTDDRFKLIINGTNYLSVFGTATRWNGLVVNGDESLIAYYVYYYYMKFESQKFTGLSTVVMKQDNAINVSPADKMLSAWNSCCREAVHLLDYIMTRFLIYPEFTVTNYHTGLYHFRTNSSFGL